MRKSEVLKSLAIRPDDFVVEIGSGPDPYPYTKLILEKYPFDNAERWGSVKHIAPVVQADAVRIPLKDGVCDVLFVSHVIEHLDEPDRFLGEATRCAKNIYLEFPTFYRELMYAWSFHKWVIEIHDFKLICYRNDIPQMFGDYFHRNYDLLLHIWSEERFEEMNSYIFCDPAKLTLEISNRSAMDVAMERGAKGAEKVNFAEVKKVPYSSFRLFLLFAYNMLPEGIARWKRRLTRSAKSRMQSLDASLLEKFICIKCGRGALQKNEERLRCENCGAEYPCIGGIYHFAPGNSSRPKISQD